MEGLFGPLAFREPPALGHGQGYCVGGVGGVETNGLLQWSFSTPGRRAAPKAQ